MLPEYEERRQEMRRRHRRAMLLMFGIPLGLLVACVVVAALVVGQLGDAMDEAGCKGLQGLVQALWTGEDCK